VVFEVTPAGAVKVLYTLNSADGCSPYAGLVRDAKGTLYGTTGSCGAYGFGTVFQVTKKGTATVLYSFTGGAGGGQPIADLLRDKKAISTAQPTKVALRAALVLGAALYSS
jgi:uncharacterized repeat protein (TIGR03803 family)